MQSLLNRSRSVKREPRINLSRNLARNNLQYFLAKLHEQAVKSGINLLVDGLALLLAGRDGSVNQTGVFRLLGGSQDQGRVGSGILGLVLADG